MSDKRISIELTEEQVRALVSYQDSTGTLGRIADAARAALAAHRRSTRAGRYGAPWEAVAVSVPVDERDVYSTPPYNVLAAHPVAADRSNEIGLSLPEHIAKMVAAAPALAVALEGLVNVGEEDGRWEDAERVAREALRLSGWSDGGGE